MKKSKAVKMIELVAVREGVSVAEVRREMQKALDHAYENNTDDLFWNKWKGRKPTIDEFIVAVSDDVLTRFACGKATLT